MHLHQILNSNNRSLFSKTTVLPVLPVQNVYESDFFLRRMLRVPPQGVRAHFRPLPAAPMGLGMTPTNGGAVSLGLALLVYRCAVKRAGLRARRSQEST